MALHERELKSRVLRLLSGTFEAEDLNAMYLFLRDRRYGVHTVKEVGDCIAHRVARTQGYVQNNVTNFFDSVRIKLSPPGSPSNFLNKAPPGFRRVLLADYDRMPDRSIKTSSGIKKKDGRKLLISALNKFAIESDGTERLAGTLTASELAIINFAIGLMVTELSFSEAQLFEGLKFTLTKADLLAKGDVKKFSDARAFIALHAICSMHLVEIPFPDGTKADLIGGYVATQLQVSARKPHPLPQGGFVSIVAPVFTTKMSAKEWCHPSLLTANESDGYSELWDAPIEVSQEPKIIPIG